MLSVCLFILLINFWMADPVFMKLGMYEGYSESNLCLF
jgi:hypothetical protein